MKFQHYFPELPPKKKTLNSYLDMWPIATLFIKFSDKLHEDFIELVKNSSMKSDSKSSPIYVVWVVSSRNGTDNKVGELTLVFKKWGRGLKFENRI